MIVTYYVGRDHADRLHMPIRSVHVSQAPEVDERVEFLRTGSTGEPYVETYTVTERRWIINDLGDTCCSVHVRSGAP